MSPEKELEKPDGERWLELLGYGHLKGQSTGYYLVDGEPVLAEDFAKLGLDGEPVLTEEFDKLCGKYARPVFVGLESIDPTDPEYDAHIEDARETFQRYFSPEERETA